MLLKKVLAMVKQLEIPAFFSTLSCVDLKRNEILTTTRSYMKLILTFQVSHIMIDVKILNENPVLVVRHFQYCC